MIFNNIFPLANNSLGISNKKLTYLFNVIFSLDIR